VSGAAGDRDVERFRRAVAQGLGLQFDETRFEFLADVLQRRLARTGRSADLYLHDLETGAAAGEPAALARELTVGETYFFRNPDQFRAFAELVVPECRQARAGSRTLRILSAGCASGEEAYSLAILLREAACDPTWTVEIRGVDLNPAVIEKASRGRYSPWALRETPAAIRQKWFRAEGRELILDKAVRADVHFEQRNLASDDPVLWQPQSLDVVFCRNVVMYFTPDHARGLIARIAQALRPGGYLFLGHAETLRGVSDAFQLRHTHGTFYYQLKAEAEFQAPPRLPAPRSVSSRIDLPDGSDAWIEVIRNASDRVAALASGSKPASRAACDLPARWDLTPVFELLRTERFTEALALIRSLPPASARDPDVLLLTATLLAHSGHPTEAEATCRRLLVLDDLNAGAHYVLALCREAAGDRDAAVERDRVAAYLDPAFAMPRLHLGLLARRIGDRDAARRELGHALLLLRREDPSRLLLFGGGFSRDALLALCESALRDCGGQ
jgi:chemotaxis protein methyltransferase CheR